MGRRGKTYSRLLNSLGTFVVPPIMDSTAPIHTWHRGVHTPIVLGSATGRSSQFQRLASGLGIPKVTAGRRGGGWVAGEAGPGRKGEAQ